MNLPKKLLLRNRLIVDRGLQFDLVTRTVIFVLFVFCALYAMVFAPLVREISENSRDGQVPHETVGALMFIQERFWPVGIACLVVAILGALFVSHRIAGPLVRVKRVMRFVQEGHFPRPLETRPRDYFKTEVDVLNDMVGSIAGRIAELRRAATELRHALAAYSELTATPAQAEVRAALARVREGVDEMGNLLDEFTTQSDVEPEALPFLAPETAPASGPAHDPALAAEMPVEAEQRN